MAKGITDKVKFTTNIDKDLLLEIKNQANNEGVYVNVILERLIQEYLRELNHRPRK